MNDNFAHEQKQHSVKYFFTVAKGPLCGDDVGSYMKKVIKKKIKGCLFRAEHRTALMFTKLAQRFSLTPGSISKANNHKLLYLR